jgi:hypothetical protein
MHSQGPARLRVPFQSLPEIQFRFANRAAFQVQQSTQGVKVAADGREELRVGHVRGPEFAFKLDG